MPKNDLQVSETTKLRKQIADLEAQNREINYTYRKNVFLKLVQENITLMERVITLEQENIELG